MANVQWDVAHDLVTPGGTVLFNQPDGATGRTYRILPNAYKMVPSLRVTADNISQADGSVLHPRWKTGMTLITDVRFDIQHGSETKPACNADLRVMVENLARALNSIRSFQGGTQRMIWTPTGAGSRRMLDDIQTLAWMDPTFDESTLFETAQFAVETEFPYAIDLTQISTAIAPGATVTLTNPGTSDFKPVIQVAGPFSKFTLTNTTTGLKVVYDSSRDGAVGVAVAHYAEIDFFRGTVFLDGNSTDLIAGIDPTATDFFPLTYLGGGVNAVSQVATGAGGTATVLWNPAWS